MEQWIMEIMAVFALLGGIDRMLGNRFGLGKKFEAGFDAMGPLAASMAGIICVVPLLSALFQRTLVPLCLRLGIDPSFPGSCIAIDMGGYDLARQLQIDPRAGVFTGVIAACTFGCTVSFTIPFGMEVLNGEKQRAFSRGILYGLSTLPVSLIIGGLGCGMSLMEKLRQSLPILILAALLFIGLLRCPAKMIRGFAWFGKAIMILGTFGLCTAAYQSISGRTLIPALTPLEEAMEIVVSICIVLLGAMPFSEALRLLLERPLRGLSRRSGIASDAFTNIFLGAVSTSGAILSLKELDPDSVLMNAAFLVSGAAFLSAHLAFTAARSPEVTGVMIAAKLSGAAAALILCWALEIKKKSPSHTPERA